MTKVQKSNDATTKELRWAARTASPPVIGLFALFMAESGKRIIFTRSWSSPREMPLFLVLCIAGGGVVVAWRLPAIGGILAVAGAVAVVALAYTAAGPGLLLAAIFFSFPLFVAGALHLSCSVMARARSSALDDRSPAIQTGTRLTVA